METNKELREAIRAAMKDAQIGYGTSGANYDGNKLAAGITAALSQRSEAVPFGYVAVITSAGGTIYHRSRVMADRKGAEDCAKQWKDDPYQGTISVLPLYTAPAPSAAAGEQVMQCHPDITKRIRSIVDLLGLQSDMPEDDLTGYEWAVLGLVRSEIARLKAAAQPTPAQGDAVPVDSVALNLEAQLRSAIAERDALRNELATRQSSADAVDAARWRAYRVSAAACMSGLHSESLDSAVYKIIDSATAIAAQGGKGEKE